MSDDSAVIIERIAKAIFSVKPDCAGKPWPFDTDDGRRAYPHNPVAAVDLCFTYARKAYGAAETKGPLLAQLRGVETYANAQLTAARTEIYRLLTLTSEQATEIVGKDKALLIAEAKLSALSSHNCEHDGCALPDAYEKEAENFATRYHEYKRLSEAQSVLLKKAETALETIASKDQWIEDARITARAVLSELQLKGK